MSSTQRIVIVAPSSIAERYVEISGLLPEEEDGLYQYLERKYGVMCVAAETTHPYRLRVVGLSPDALCGVIAHYCARNQIVVSE